VKAKKTAHRGGDEVCFNINGYVTENLGSENKLFFEIMAGRIKRLDAAAWRAGCFSATHAATSISVKKNNGNHLRKLNRLKWRRA